jgi:hypothetical protein
MMDTHEEKRQITRVDYPVRGQAEYKGTIFPGEIINFSLNGLLFKSDELMDIAEQEKVAISINWDDAEEDPVSTIHCIVVRNDNQVAGLKFDVIDYDTLMALREKLAAKIGDKINEEFINFLISSN